MFHISGANLSQDRGRLEAKIEQQATEIAGLKKQLEVRTQLLVDDINI